MVGNLLLFLSQTALHHGVGVEEVVDEGDDDHTQDKHAEAIGVEIDSDEELFIKESFPELRLEQAEEKAQVLWPCIWDHDSNLSFADEDFFEPAEV